MKFHYFIEKDGNPFYTITCKHTNIISKNDKNITIHKIFDNDNTTVIYVNIIINKNHNTLHNYKT